MTKRYLLQFLFVLFAVGIGVAQEKDSINTEVINVVKPYTPKISDSFKIIELPQSVDVDSLEKKEIQYTIQSVPVASTFKPVKGKAAGVEKVQPKTYYKNYASLGVGSYLNVAADLFVAIPVTQEDNIGLAFQHQSTQGEIEGVQLDNKYYDTNLGLSYRKKDRYFSYNIKADFAHQLYNWYGTSYPFTDAQRADIDASHVYYTAGVSASFEAEESVFNGGEVQYQRFWDSYSASENWIKLQPKFLIDIADYEINLLAHASYLGGSFPHETPEIAYSQFVAGVQPSYKLSLSELELVIGAEVNMFLDSEHSETSLNIFPKVKASYALLENKLTAFVGADGQLIQNSYASLVSENRYMSPNLFLVPSVTPLNFFAGLKGGVSKAVTYNIQGGYAVENDKVQFVMNPVNSVLLVEENYQKANSFTVFYEDVKTVYAKLNMQADLHKNYSIKASLNYYNYKASTQENVYNLPQIEADVSATAKFSDKWSAALQLFYVGERTGYLRSNVFGIENQKVELNGFADVNASINYKVTNRFSVFVKGNNLANQSYQNWQTYQVQGLQVMGGLSYQFDF